MSDLDKYRFRSGYVVSLDAWRRYLTVGHRIPIPDVEPEHHSDYTYEEEEVRLQDEEHAEFELTMEVQQEFRILRREAPLNIRVWIVLPHSRWFYSRTSHAVLIVLVQLSLVSFRTKSMGSATADVYSSPPVRVARLCARQNHAKLT